ncbi:hybrid sensor histidine kinase/response regulator [Gloeobacter kilaueensis]|uniref:histidine kinase n=1 Tax=Gloeobacter kilaueensis (strain ATCC BAA-2537 / CCAP 1431/1 / ULC 316 / JS1) TaxID=1183438 RepID=U5QM65_GLOK1|nr:hybrid sensor histidine kinase/response regulator [Gloeobacter kilaueensis]AGY58765.1 response regulator receiver sensor signal transduction histidine kinase [Gloeobacter kilaueensis JS1]
MSPAPERILVVDDLPDNIVLVQFLLSSEGYQIETASSGPECLEKVYKNPPDLVLLDVMMPGMDGYEVTRRIKSDLRLPFLPILLVTASDRPSAALGLDAGADEFIRKPIEPDELLARVRSLLRLKRSITERDTIARQREDFVTRLAHDLRTPLVAADRMFGLLNQGALGEMPPQMAEAISIMNRSNSNLLALVRTLLDVYRYEAGAKRLHFQPTDLVELAEQVCAELAPLATEKRLELDTNLKPVPRVQADHLELRRVLTNLIGNAIKFTDQGSIRVCTNAVDSLVCFAVSDTGPGIRPEEQAALFRRFSQGSHNKEGSGMGLHLSRQIVEAHGGTLSLESEPGRGSNFTVRLPVHS